MEQHHDGPRQILDCRLFSIAYYPPVKDTPASTHILPCHKLLMAARSSFHPGLLKQPSQKLQLLNKFYQRVLSMLSLGQPGRLLERLPGLCYQFPRKMLTRVEFEVACVITSMVQSALHRRPVCSPEDIFQVVIFEFFTLGLGDRLSLLRGKPCLFRSRVTTRFELNHKFPKTSEIHHDIVERGQCEVFATIGGGHESDTHDITKTFSAGE